MSSILIAEDDPAIREGLEAALQSDGHETRDRPARHPPRRRPS